MSEEPLFKSSYLDDDDGRKVWRQGYAKDQDDNIGELPALLREPKKEIYPFFVACHPRSGSQMVSWTLETRGMRLGHERHFKEGIVSWLHVGSGWHPETPNEVDRRNYAKVVHLVREPLACISSAAFTKVRGVAIYMKENFPELPDLFDDGEEKEQIEARIRFYMASWVVWNRAIEALGPVVRLRVERMVEDWEVWMACFGPPVSWDSRPPYQWKVKPNAMAHPDLEWHHLETVDQELAWEVRKLGNEYGY